jgi:exopolysaccharide biosynthesis polyprenyl glycosylphosphotransferase
MKNHRPFGEAALKIGKNALLRGGFYRLPAGFLLSIRDFCCCLVIPMMGSFFPAAHENLTRDLLYWYLVAALTVALINSYGGYRPESLAKSNLGAWRAIGCYLAISMALLAVALLMGHAQAVSRFWTLAAVAGTPVLLGGARWMPWVQAPAAAGRLAAGPVVICFNQAPADLRHALAAQNISPAASGVLYLAERRAGSADAGWPVIPDVQTLLDTMRAQAVQDVVFIYQPELEFIPAPERAALLSELMAFPARIWLAFDLAANLPPPLASRGGHYRLVPVVTDGLLNSLNLPKRLFDIFFSFVLLLVVWPVLVVLAGLVRLSGPGPVVFRQVRTGAQGRRFTVLKFRTMRHGDAGEVFAQARKGDARVTWIGRFLRRCSLDELLQLVNVLKGEMSLVGPRPHAPQTQVEGVGFEDAVKLYRLRYRVKPGITGLAQIRGHRGETARLANLEQRLASDLEYIETWSLWLDVLILLRTLPVMVLPQNAY